MRIEQAYIPQPAVPEPRPGEGVQNFLTALKGSLEGVEQLQQRSAGQGEALARGTADSLHRVITEVEEASIALDLAVHLRNRAIEAYQEVLRIQI